MKRRNKNIELMKLKESEERFRNLAEHIPIGVQGYTMDGTIIYWNKASEKIYGFTSEEAVGKNIGDLIIPDEIKPLLHKGLEIASKFQTSGEFLPSGEVSMLRKDSSRVVVHSIHTIVCIEDCPPTLYCIDVDLTEQKKIENDIKSKNIELERLNQSRAEFVSTISHDLRTPLSAIKESINMVLDGLAGETTEDQRKFLSLANKNLDRLNRLIDDLLDLRKLEAGKMLMNIRPNDIRATVNEVVSFYSPLASERHLFLRADNPHYLPPIEFDKDKILQVLHNYLSNALKFTHEGGITVHIEHDSWNNGVKVCVEDTGEGIGSENIQKVFKPFEQFSNNHKTKNGGTGLGLAICKKIIEQHHGAVWFQSELGKGSRFWFTIPSNSNSTN